MQPCLTLCPSSLNLSFQHNHSTSGLQQFYKQIKTKYELSNFYTQLLTHTFSNTHSYVNRTQDGVILHFHTLITTKSINTFIWTEELLLLCKHTLTTKKIRVEIPVSMPLKNIGDTMLDLHLQDNLAHESIMWSVSLLAAFTFPDFFWYPSV